jgi:PAS domain-containing protein
VPGKKSADFPNRHQPADDFEKALNELGKAEADLRGIIDIIPALGWCNRLEGSVEFVSQPWQEYAGAAFRGGA